MRALYHLFIIIVTRCTEQRPYKYVNKNNGNDYNNDCFHKYHFLKIIYSHYYAVIAIAIPVFYLLYLFCVCAALSFLYFLYTSMHSPRTITPTATSAPMTALCHLGVHLIHCEMFDISVYGPDLFLLS